jgi:Putative inner membrane exporter, YdcZ
LQQISHLRLLKGGAAMNGQLNKYVVNSWLASAISFALITFFFAGASLILPTQKDLAELSWWAVVGGLVGASRRSGCAQRPSHEAAFAFGFVPI